MSNSSFEIGTKVSLLNEVGEYLVLKQEGLKVFLRDEHGFENWHDVKLLVGRREIRLEEIEEKKEDEQPVSAILKKTDLPSIDLHAENLVDLPAKYEKHQLFELQLQHFRRFMHRMESLKNPRFIVVHGVGNGTLQGAIREIINGIPGASMEDANFSANGVGASLIIRRYNWR